MDILVMLEESAERSPVLAHVNSVPLRFNAEHPSRDVVTIYGSPSTESVALAIAAAVESRRASGSGTSDTIRHLGLWAERGAVGDVAWRDEHTGQLVTQDLDIPLEILRETAKRILAECGGLVQRLVAGLVMPDWPEGVRRAINFTYAPAAFVGIPVIAGAGVESMLDNVRESDALAYDTEEA